VKAIIVLVLVGSTGAAYADPTCSFGQVGDLDLVSGATTSTIEIHSTKDCLQKLGSETVLSSASGSMRATVKTDRDVATLSVQDVPTLAPGTLDCKIGDIGTVALKTTAITMQKLIVTYGEQRIDARQVVVASKSDQGWIAVAQHKAPNGDPDQENITNTAQIDTSPRLLYPPYSSTPRRKWILRGTTWGSSVDFQYEGDAQDRRERRINLARIQFGVTERLKLPLQVGVQLTEDKTVLIDIELTLAVEARRESIPLPLASAVTISCWADRWFDSGPIKQAGDGGAIAIDDDAFANKQCKLAVEYAKERDKMMAALPTKADQQADDLRQAAKSANDERAKASKDVAAKRNAAKRASAERASPTTVERDKAEPRPSTAQRNLENRELQAAQTVATNADQAAQTATRALHDNESLRIKEAARAWNIYGDQALEITVKRGTKQGVSVVVVSPLANAEFPLTAPLGAEQETGPYHVSIRLVSQKDVVYREGTLPSDNTTDARLSFDATLVPRGKFGLTYPVRFYVTFPVSPVSFRFPARTADLQSTTDTHTVQMESRAGAMLVLEPWDYARDRNPFRIPLSFQAGLSATSVALNRTSVMAGVSIDVPIIDKSFTETSLALGVFYEVGLEDSWRRTHRGFVITAGLDIFRALRSNKATDQP